MAQAMGKLKKNGRCSGGASLVGMAAMASGNPHFRRFEKCGQIMGKVEIKKVHFSWFWGPKVYVIDCT